MAALEKAATETLLEMTDLVADGRRRQVEPGRRPGEAQMPRRRLEGTQRMEGREAGHLGPLTRREAATEHTSGVHSTCFFSLSLRERVGVRAAVRLRERGVNINSACAGDRVQHAFAILIHLVVPASAHSPATRFQPSRSSILGHPRRRALAAIYLDH